MKRIANRWVYWKSRRHGKPRLVFLALLCCIFCASLEAKKKIASQERCVTTEQAPSSLRTLLGSLDPLCLSQHLAFYELYPDTPEGKRALERAWSLLGMSPCVNLDQLPISHAPDLQGLVSLITRSPSEPAIQLSASQLSWVEQLALDLHHQTLKGHQIWSRKEALALSNEETDLARTLLLFQFPEEPSSQEEIRRYEADLDLMALQIQARLKPGASHEDKLREINQFIFHQMQFRFPPRSLHAADIDLYTFLPSVLDGRQGVCLGVSILYLSLAQRLDLPLEIITPPGHIYVRYNNGRQIINIETTARGIDLPSEVYLGINTHSLRQRSVKEVVGLAFMNQAAVCWSKERYPEAVMLYEKALLFMPSDPLLKMFMGFNYLFVGKMAQGTQLLKEVRTLCQEDAISAETIPDDYLRGKVDIAGIKAVFLPVDETRESILQKQKELEAILKRYPHYRAGLLQLATTWLQLGRTREAQEVLERYHRIDPHHCIIEYYLAALSAERVDYASAKRYLDQLESLLKAKQHAPKALSSLRQQLIRVYPNP